MPKLLLLLGGALVILIVPALPLAIIIWKRASRPPAFEYMRWITRPTKNQLALALAVGLTGALHDINLAIGAPTAAAIFLAVWSFMLSAGVCFLLFPIAIWTVTALFTHQRGEEGDADGGDAA
jgi:4-amino-4-deoxy-L-arabinose transferase-like glycosyltransferase